MAHVKSPVDMLDHWAATRGEAIYLRQPRGGAYRDFTWGEVRQQALQLAGALRHLGYEPGDRIGLLSKNCAEWFIVDLALMAGGYVSVPIYPTANAGTIRHIIDHSGARAVFVGPLDSAAETDAGIEPGISKLALPYDTLPADHGWEQLLRLGTPLERPDHAGPDRVMTIVYTSGSTGLPKGVVHRFSSMGWAGATLCRQLGGSPDDRVVSYLPLAHITERAYIEIGSLYTGGSVAFVESRESFLDDVKRGAPTLFISVPRLWTLFQKNIQMRLGPRKLAWSRRVPFFGGLVRRAIRRGLGLTHARVIGCGSAPVAPTLIEWYRQVGMNITEAWGMTENAAYATLNYPFNPDKIGSVGRPAPDCEVRVSEQGELLFRGPGVMSEYYRDPEATARALTPDGFLRTGDLCRIDADGYVFITGRVGDTFKTAKGKFVSPVPIENALAANDDVELSCVIGSGLPQPVALVQLSGAARGRPRDTLRGSLEATLGSVNAGLESHAKLDAVIVVEAPWTTENDVLTPTLKIRRHILDRRFGSRVEGVRGGQVRWEDELEAGD